MRQSCKRYFFLLNLFGFFFLSATALEAEPVERSKECSGDSCILSACSTLDHTPTFSYNLQPILSVAVARDADPSIASVYDVSYHQTFGQSHSSVPTLAVAPKQSPPASA